MKAISLATVIITGFLTLSFYTLINYALFGDFGFVPAGRIVFASRYGYFDYLILPPGIMLGMYIFRQRLKEAAFKRLFEFGWKTAIAASVTFSAFIFTYLQFIDPGYFHKLVELIGQTDIRGKEPTSFVKEMLARAKSIKETELFRNPLFYTTANFSIYFLLGILSSFLFATILKRNHQG
jgi:hypothetical protein